MGSRFNVTIPDALQHFERMGYKCPAHTNPADCRFPTSSSIIQGIRIQNNYISNTVYLDTITPDTRDPNAIKRVEKFHMEWDKIKDRYVTPIGRGLIEDATRTKEAVRKNKKAAKGLRKDWDGGKGEGTWGVGWFEEVGILLGRNFKVGERMAVGNIRE